MELFTGEKRKQKNKMKKKKKIIIGILIAAVIAAAGITWYVMTQKNQKTGNSSAEVVAWDVDIEEKEPSQEKGILIPGYTSMVMKANTKEQTVSIGNPADNDCIFVIVLKLEDGTKLFESQELKPGEGLENITLDQELKAGEYQAVIEYKCYSLEDKEHLQDESTANAKTGDASNVRTWIMILIFSMLVFGCGVKYKKGNK